MACDNKFILDMFKSSGEDATIKYLVDHPQCNNPNEKSLRSELVRQLAKLTNLRKSASRPKGKTDLETFLSQTFPFPSKVPHSRFLILCFGQTVILF